MYSFSTPKPSYYRQLYYITQLKRYQRFRENVLKGIQEKRLRALINHAYQNVPFYHNLFDSAGIKAQDVKNVELRCDTVIMNPPFGAQKSNKKADRKFIEKGFEIAKVVYSIHLKKTITFIEKLINSLNGTITYQKDYIFPIKDTFFFHKKQVLNFEVTLLRIITKKQ